MQVLVDPVEFKRQSALKVGATHAFASIDEADAFAKSKTNGPGADSAIVTIGVVLDELITRTYSLDQVAQGYDDMHAGKNIRGVVVF